MFIECIMANLLTSFLEECINRDNKIRYYSGFSETGFFEGYDPINHIFDKSKVERTGGREATWLHIPHDLEISKTFLKYSSYWFSNHVFHKGETIKKAAHNAIFIVDWDPTFLPWWPKGKVDNPGDPVVFSGIVSFKDLGYNGFYSSKKPVNVDKLYKVILNKNRKKYEHPKKILLEDISYKL